MSDAATLASNTVAVLPAAKEQPCCLPGAFPVVRYPGIPCSMVWASPSIRPSTLTASCIPVNGGGVSRDDTSALVARLGGETFLEECRPMLGNRPPRPTKAGRQDPHRATERARRRGYAHRTTKRATCRGNGPRPTGDQTRGHDPPGAAAPQRNRYRTGTCTREVEGIQPEAPGWMR